MESSQLLPDSPSSSLAISLSCFEPSLRNCLYDKEHLNQISKLKREVSLTLSPSEPICSTWLTVHSLLSLVPAS